MVLTRGCEEYRQLVSQFNWDVNTALAVMKAESGCNPESNNTGLNQNGTADKGLFQINDIHVTSGLIGDQERFNPAANIKAAFAIYEGSGWKAWSAYNAGKHLKFLN